LDVEAEGVELNLEVAREEVVSENNSKGVGRKDMLNSCSW
jgi:hypothetical protein